MAACPREAAAPEDSAAPEDAAAPEDSAALEDSAAPVALSGARSHCEGYLYRLFNLRNSLSIFPTFCLVILLAGSLCKAFIYCYIILKWPRKVLT